MPKQTGSFPSETNQQSDKWLQATGNSTPQHCQVVPPVAPSVPEGEGGTEVKISGETGLCSVAERAFCYSCQTDRLHLHSLLCHTCTHTQKQQHLQVVFPFSHRHAITKLFKESILKGNHQSHPKSAWKVFKDSMQ